MSAPSTDSVIILLFNLAGYVLLWVRGNRKDAIREFQHGKLWNDYEKRYGINGYGKKEGSQ